MAGADKLRSDVEALLSSSSRLLASGSLHRSVSTRSSPQQPLGRSMSMMSSRSSSLRLRAGLGPTPEFPGLDLGSPRSVAAPALLTSSPGGYASPTAAARQRPASAYGGSSLASGASHPLADWSASSPFGSPKAGAAGRSGHARSVSFYAASPPRVSEGLRSSNTGDVARDMAALLDSVAKTTRTSSPSLQRGASPSGRFTTYRSTLASSPPSMARRAGDAGGPSPLSRASSMSPSVLLNRSPSMARQGSPLTRDASPLRASGSMARGILRSPSMFSTRTGASEALTTTGSQARGGLGRANSSALLSANALQPPDVQRYLSQPSLHSPEVLKAIALSTAETAADEVVGAVKALARRLQEWGNVEDAVRERFRLDLDVALSTAWLQAHPTLPPKVRQALGKAASTPTPGIPGVQGSQGATSADVPANTPAPTEQLAGLSGHAAPMEHAAGLSGHAVAHSASVSSSYSQHPAGAPGHGAGASGHAAAQQQAGQQPWQAAGHTQQQPTTWQPPAPQPHQPPSWQATPHAQPHAAAMMQPPSQTASHHATMATPAAPHHPPHLPPHLLHHLVATPPPFPPPSYSTAVSPSFPTLGASHMGPHGVPGHMAPPGPSVAQYQQPSAPSPLWSAAGSPLALTPVFDATPARGHQPIQPTQPTQLTATWTPSGHHHHQGGPGAWPGDQQPQQHYHQPQQQQQQQQAPHHAVPYPQPLAAHHHHSPYPVPPQPQAPTPAQDLITQQLWRSFSENPAFNPYSRHTYSPPRKSPRALSHDPRALSHDPRAPSHDPRDPRAGQLRHGHTRPVSAYARPPAHASFSPAASTHAYGGGSHGQQGGSMGHGGGSHGQRGSAWGTLHGSVVAGGSHGASSPSHTAPMHPPMWPMHAPMRPSSASSPHVSAYHGMHHHTMQVEGGQRQGRQPYPGVGSLGGWLAPAGMHAVGGVGGGAYAHAGGSMGGAGGGGPMMPVYGDQLEFFSDVPVSVSISRGGSPR